MCKRFPIPSLLVLAVIILASPAMAQAPPTIGFAFDENGIGFIAINFNPTAVPGTPGGSGGVVYNLFVPGVFTLNITPGDWIIQEDLKTNSDLIRFAGGPQPTLTFFSDIEAGSAETDLADTGLPTILLTNVVMQSEGPVGSFGQFGATYIPTSGQPGFCSNCASLFYTAISDNDPVPEPATALLVLPAAGLIWLRRRARKARA